MPMALSGGPYVYSTFSGGSRSSICNGIRSGLAAAGWVDTGASGTATGRRLRGTSPQGLTLDVDVFDAGEFDNTTPIVRVQFGYPDGFGHTLGIYGVTYQIVANPCQFFVSVIGTASAAPGTTVCGGIPFLPTVAGGTDPDCGNAGVNGNATTEAWWSTGDGVWNIIFAAATMRVSLESRFAPGGIAASEGKFNGSFCQGGGVGASRLIALTFSGGPSGPARYVDGSPFIVEPLIGWGDTQNARVRVRGQLWDSMFVCEAHPMDDTSSIFGTQQLDQNFTWMNYVNNVTEGSLYLITGENTVAGSDSYVY